MKLNKKGFTLIELIATIVILGLVASIGAYSITKVMEQSRKNNYNLLVANIHSAAVNYYNYCRFEYSSKTIVDSGSPNGNNCTFLKNASNSMTLTNVTLGRLVAAGFLTSNKTKEDVGGRLYHPETNDEMSNCKIEIKLVNDKAMVSSLSTGTAFCPQTDDFKNMND